MSHKQVIIIRKDLKMRTGKAIVQGAHASMGAILSRCVRTVGPPHDNTKCLTLSLDDPRIEPWINGAFTKICVSVNSEQELLDLETKAKEAGLITCLITDNGLTEFNGVPTITALAIGPDTKDKIDEVTGRLLLL